MPFELLPDGNVQTYRGVFDETHGLRYVVPGTLLRPSDPDYERIMTLMLPEEAARARAHLEAYRRGLAEGETGER